MTQETVSLPASHGDVRTALNNNANDAETRLSKADKCRMGWANFDDDTTSTTPISVPSGITTWTQLTNDKAGAATFVTYLPEGLDTNVFASNEFDFSDLVIGDTMDIRTDLLVTTSGANQRVKIRLRLGIGSGSEVTLFLDDRQYKTAGVQQIISFNSIFIGGASTRDYPARLEIASDGTANCEVNGWYCRFLLRGEAS